VIELQRGARPLVIGHRGAAALAPENSLAAIGAAAAAGVDGVEIDVLVRSDGEPVVAHGPEVPADAPRLADALELVARLEVFVQLDLKSTGVERAVVEGLHAAGLLERSFVSSFSLPILAELARREPALPRSLTYPEDRYGVTGKALLRPFVRPGLAAMRAALPHRLPRWLHAVGATAATLNWAVATPAVIKTCHELGVAVLVWTVNDPNVVKILVERGVDAIISDDPRATFGGISGR
jgi:glycerophosphoryl diester phosphodiesterase